ncbi:MAG: cation:proton antiporter [Phycisphaerales bacterium]|nr:cation:proton antiporter [Phycisphaerales bacterium]
MTASLMEPGYPMHLDPIIPILCVIAILVLALAIIMKRFQQPHVVAYVLAGVMVGPSGLGIVRDLDSMSRLGSIGIVLLLFFVGMEVNLPSLIRRWRIAVGGTVLQIVLSLGAIWVLGLFLDWPVNRIVLLGFVISLSSTAVVFKMLHDRGEADSRVGQNVTGILLVQDLAIVPMLVVVSFFGGDAPSVVEVSMQLVGAVAIVAVVAWAVRHRSFPLPLQSVAGEDGELQLLVGMLSCFGLALLTGLLGLSSALGAFVAGILVVYSRQGDWIHDRLAPFRDLTVGAFFLSVGMLIDPSYLLHEWVTIVGLVTAVFITNTVINAGAIRMLGEPWAESWYAGAMLAQVGELSFLLAAIGVRTGAISNFAYQATVATIAVTLTLSPPWIAVVRRLSGVRQHRAALQRESLGDWV